MVYFRTVVLLVQVLSVLVNGGVGSGGAESDQLTDVYALGAPVDLEDDGNDLVFFDYDDFSQNCNKELLSLNEPLATVFASVAEGLKFKPNCTEINLAEQHYKETNVFWYATNKTHVSLGEKNVESLSDVEGIRREFGSGSALKNELVQKGFAADGSVIPFGCAPGKGDVVVVCYYRRPGVTVQREEEWYEYESGIQSDDGPRESESSPGQQESVFKSEEGTPGQQVEA